MNAKEFERLRNAVEKARTAVDRAQGARDQNMRILQDEFGCDSIKQAEAKLDTLTRKERRLQRELETQVKNFKSKWKRKLSI